MKASQIFGMILAIALIVFSIAFPVPEKHLRVSGYSYDTKSMLAAMRTTFRWRRL